MIKNITNSVRFTQNIIKNIMHCTLRKNVMSANYEIYKLHNVFYLQWIYFFVIQFNLEFRNEKHDVFYNSKNTIISKKHNVLIVIKNIMFF